MTTHASNTSFPAQGTGLSFPVLAAKYPVQTLQTVREFISRSWRWVQTRQVARSNSRRLQLSETISLGEKRFVAVIEVDGLQFLIGGGPATVTLLAQLEAKKSFGELLKEKMTLAEIEPAKSMECAMPVENAKQAEPVKRMRKPTSKRTEALVGGQE